MPRARWWSTPLCVIDREGGGADVVGRRGDQLHALFTMRDLEATGSGSERPRARSRIEVARLDTWRSSTASFFDNDCRKGPRGAR